MKKFIFFASFLFIGCIAENENLIPKGLGVPFHTGMSACKWFKYSWVQKNPVWKRVKNLYNTYINNIECDPEPRIPKIIHQIWVGSPLPQKYYHWQESWKKYHPDWEYKLWTDKDIEEFGLTNKHWYDKTPNYGQKADVARYEILYRLGGVYVDIDFECIQPLDVLHHTCDFYVGIVPSPQFKLNNALFGSVPRSAILKECIETMNLDIKYSHNPKLNVIYTAGPLHLTRCFLKKAAGSGKCVAFPVNYFYPCPIRNERDPQKIALWIKPESFANHHWAGTWVQQSLLRKFISWLN